MRKHWLFFLDGCTCPRGREKRSSADPEPPSPHTVVPVWIHRTEIPCAGRSEALLAPYPNAALPDADGFRMLNLCSGSEGILYTQVHTEAPDVAEERQRVEELGKGDNRTAIVLRNLCKVYPSEVRPRPVECGIPSTPCHPGCAAPTWVLLRCEVMACCSRCKRALQYATSPT